MDLLTRKDGFSEIWMPSIEQRNLESAGDVLVPRPPRTSLVPEVSVICARNCKPEWL